MDRLNLSPGWLSWERHDKDKAEDAVQPSVLQPALSGYQSMEKGQVGPTCSTAAGGHDGPRGAH